MKRIRILSALLALAVLATLAIVTTTSKHGVRAVYASSGCTDATLQGNFGFVWTGFGTEHFITKGPTNAPFAAVGLGTFDGAGNFSGSFTASGNGSISTNVPFSVPYSVNSNCTGVMGAANVSDTFALVIVGGGAEVLAIVTSSGGTETLDLKKQ
jgi:hypothetical protein